MCKASQAWKVVSGIGFTLDKVCRSYRKQRRGSAAVEFALVAPLFFILVFGMIEIGRMVMVQQVITNASREGARLAVLDTATVGEIKSTVEDFLACGMISGAAVIVSPDPPSDAAHGEPVTVTVEIAFDKVSWLPSPVFLGDVNLSASTAMRRESVQ
ncbi:MAG: pilus assembly protein TadE [Planctomycetaceae bacterium]|nr:pilus assembly protein TadE [Planctomycetaceae bacterium]MBP61655.1 pilus assembly protein TadE [Planctomycetaceae bacterium]